MNRLLFLAACCAASIALCAQNQTSILDSKNVTWAGVAVLAYPIDFPDSLEWAVGYYAADPVKIATDRYPQFSPTGFFASRLFADVWSGALPAFELAASPGRALNTIWDSLAADQQRPLSRADWQSWLAADLNDAQAASRLAGTVQTYRFKTLYFYDKRQRALQARIEGVVLDLLRPGMQAERLVCYIPLPEQPVRAKFSHKPEAPEYAYVADVTRMINFERDVLTVKGSTEALFCHWIWCPLQKRRVKGYALRDDAAERRKPVKFKTYWKQYVDRRDTLLVTDPETQEERITVIDHSVDQRLVRRASVQQRFFYDERRRALFVEVRMVSPAVPRYDADGNFRFDVPLVHVPVGRQ